MRIFLSHSSRDRAQCEALKETAEAMGIEAYLAEHDVQPGTNLAEKIKREIVRSDAIVVLLSDNGAEAPYVHQEIGVAVNAKKVVVPLVAPGVHEDRLAMLKGVEYIPFDLQAPDEGHARLKVALQGLVVLQPGE